MEGMHHLPRLPRRYYQAFAVVHWTITLEHRAVGWLDGPFHTQFRGLLQRDRPVHHRERLI